VDARFFALRRVGLVLYSFDHTNEKIEQRLRSAERSTSRILHKACVENVRFWPKADMS
jgi:hypothetical protein